MNIKSVLGKRKVKDDYLAPEVDEEFIMGEPYGAGSPKYNTFDYKEKSVIYKCKTQGGDWCVYISNIGGKPYYDYCKAEGMNVDEQFNMYGNLCRVLEVVTNKNGKVYIEDISDDLTTMPERKVSDSRRVKDGLTSSERYNRNMERIFATAERFDQNQMKWLREQGVSEDEIQNAKRNTGLHGSELSKLVLRIARENGDERENSEILGEAMGISDSRRIKDEYTEPFWYNFGGAFSDPYNIDREVEDDDYDTATYLMDKSSEIKDKYLPDNNAYNNDVEGWVNAFYEIVDLLNKTPMENPESVYEYLESDNFHDVVGLMWLIGKCGKKRQQQEIDFIKRRNDGGYRPAWYEAEDIIAEELGLI